MLTKQDKKDILNVAREARELCEILSRRHFLNRSKKITLAGYCLLASDLLYHRLKNKSFKPKFMVGENYYKGHCWIEIDDYVLDITATQFGCKTKILLIKKENYLYGKYKDIRPVLPLLNNKDYYNLVQRTHRTLRPLRYYKIYRDLKSINKDSITKLFNNNPKLGRF